MKKSDLATLERWAGAGLIDPATATRIREYEAAHAPSAKTGKAAAIAWGLGALLIGAGVISFVAANWQEMPRSTRFALVLALTAAFHIAAGFATKTPTLRLSLHGIGTICLGAGIALAGQIYNLDGKWNGWMLLWSIGAALGYWLIRDWVQLVLAALLVPLWITSEWEVRLLNTSDELPVLCFWLGIAVLYFLSRYRPLMWLGGLGLIPLTVLILVIDAVERTRSHHTQVKSYWVTLGVIAFLAVLGWFTFGGFDIRGFSAIATAVLISYATVEVGGWMLHFVMGIAFASLCAWGVASQREELINVGIVGFAITVLGFYLSHALSFLGSSFGLVVLGVLLLGGGFALEKTRRRLLGSMS